MSSKIDLVGKRFGRLLVIKENGHKSGRVAWECRCDCGRTTTVRGYSLRLGTSQSCGCLARENSRRGHSVETRKKISKAATGRRASKEARANMSKAQEKRFSARKGKRNPDWIGGRKVVGFEAASLRLSWCESVRRNPHNKKQLQAKCALCGEWFCPTRRQVEHRIAAINNNNKGDSNFYCSDKCKGACPVYNKIKYREGEQSPSQDRPGQKEWKKHIIVCSEYSCERCGKILNEKDLIAHHIRSVSQYPLESMDVDNGMALCKDCDAIVHSEKGCRPVDLRCQAQIA